MNTVAGRAAGYGDATEEVGLTSFKFESVSKRRALAEVQREQRLQRFSSF